MWSYHSLALYVGIAAGSSNTGPFFIRNVLIPMIQSVLTNMYEMESILKKSEDINWTVVRPPGLKNAPETGRVARCCYSSKMVSAHDLGLEAVYQPDQTVIFLSLLFFRSHLVPQEYLVSWHVVRNNHWAEQTFFPCPWNCTISQGTLTWCCSILAHPHKTTDFLPRAGAEFKRMLYINACLVLHSCLETNDLVHVWYVACVLVTFHLSPHVSLRALFPTIPLSKINPTHHQMQFPPLDCIRIVARITAWSPWRSCRLLSCYHTLNWVLMEAVVVVFSANML